MTKSNMKSTNNPPDKMYVEVAVITRSLQLISSE